MKQPSRRTILAAMAAALAAITGVILLPTTSPAPTNRNDTIRAVFAPTAAQPQLAARHLSLIHLLRVTWSPVEDGAPAIDIKTPLMRKGETIAVAMEAMNTTDEQLAVRTLAELGLLVPRFVLGEGTLTPGMYAVPTEMRKYFEAYKSGVDATGMFDFGQEHLALLKGSNWNIVDSDNIDEVLDGDTFWPMPDIDGKRPYGDMSYYPIDMARLLGQPYQTDASGDMIEDPDKDARLEELHTHMLAALQVFLVHAGPASAIS
jgi:hypothetical protein